MYFQIWKAALFLFDRNIMGAHMPLKPTKFTQLSAFAFGLFAITACPVLAFDPPAGTVADLAGCRDAKGCLIAGAEIDDEVTAKARAVVGSGPAAGFASDRQIKTDIKQVGQLANGIKIYSFKFIWEDKVRVGVIAQELLDNPNTKHAVLQLANGLLGVDYNAIGLRIATEEQWLQHGALAVRSDYTPQGRRSAKLDEPVRLFNRRPAN